jgi:hypothetical protein
VLDRPIDVALTCVLVECDDETGVCTPTSLSLDQCSGEATGSLPGDTGFNCDEPGRPRLVGWIANSDRNEIAPFAKCSGSVLDLDEDLPGYNFLPTGETPSSMAATEDGCRVIAANAGSCDLTVVDAPFVAARGLGFGGTPGESCAGVGNLQPQRIDPVNGWEPLAARVGAVIPWPSRLSGSVGGGGDAGCGLDRPGSVVVTFPGCGLVAEVDLRTTHILQSVQVLSDGADGWEVIDAGSSPACAVECVEQFDIASGETPGPRDPAIATGVAPIALERVSPIQADLVADEADEAVVDDTLFFGGPGAPIVFEIRMDEEGQWDPDVRQFPLAEATGVERIRATPPMLLTDADGTRPHQFLYVISLDGSTRVVDRDLSPTRTELGRECETQVDPTLGGNEPCSEILPSFGDVNPANRRPYALGPGIRAPDGSRFTDWIFKKNRSALNATGATQLPFIGAAGEVLGVGSTSGGVVYISTFAQFDDVPSVATEVDPLGTMDVGLAPHVLQPQIPAVGIDPETGAVVVNVYGTDGNSPLPKVADATPLRAIPEEAGPTRFLSPTWRRVDASYAAETAASRAAAELLGNITDVDRLGGGTFEDGFVTGGVYALGVVRAVARDYRSWFQGTWELEWEGTLPGTPSSTGLFECDAPGWEDATCRASEPGQSRLVDASANFCEAGVLSGDRVVIPGCRSDAECGPGQACLRAAAAISTSAGICVARDALEDPELVQVCEDYIDDPCGESVREWLITRATSDELWLQSLQKPVTSHLVIDPAETCEDAGQSCFGDDDCGAGKQCVGEDTASDTPGACACLPAVTEIEDRFVCTRTQPEGGCTSDEQCQALLTATEEDAYVDPDTGLPVAGDFEFRCVDQRCRRSCVYEDECLEARLPGPRCFGELVRYEVHAGDSFLLRGPGIAAFLAEDVRENPTTGECERVTSGQDAQPLLTSRIPIGPDAANLGLPACSSDAQTPGPADPNACVITSPRGSGQTLFHTMTYQQTAPVPAIRVTNPSMSVVLDLTDLDALTAEIPGLEGRLWPAEFAAFRRSRIPPGYRVVFSTAQGYRPIPSIDLTADGSNFLVLPVRLVDAPESTAFFVVDGSGPGAGGLRGQVLRVSIEVDGLRADRNFDAVR